MIIENIKTALVQTFAANENIWNTPSLVLGAIGGFFVWFLGGWDSLICTLIALIVLDFITGVIKGIYLKRLSSVTGYKGLMKKAMTIAVVGASVFIQEILPDSIPLREITIMFFVCNEGISLLENAAVLIPIPKKIKDVLLQLREKEDIQKKK